MTLNIKIMYERVFGGPNMPFLVSDIITDIYSIKYGFVVIKIDQVWTSYMPIERKVQTLNEGVSFYSDKKSYNDYKKEYEDFINSYDEVFNGIFNNLTEINSAQFERFVKLCKTAENYYAFTQYFFTDSLKNSQEFEAEFGKLKEMGRTLLNDQYFSKNNYLENVLKRVGKVINIEIDLLYNLTQEEITNLLSGGIKSLPDISKRSVFITFPDNNIKKVLYGESAEEMIKSFLQSQNDSQSKMTGTIASKGIVSGRVRVFDQGYEHKNISTFIDSMQQGEVLVAETTSPEIIVACKKAVAIVTQQGGLLSHAAIVSRELMIPCIVGVKDIVTKLKTGDMVEVDANIGVVRKI